MAQSLYEFVVSELKARRGTWETIATETGISYHTIAKIASGAISDPGVKKVEILAEYFRANQAA